MDRRSCDSLPMWTVSEKQYIESETYIVVPWYNPEQFHKVYEYLFSSELIKKRWAVDQITVWESRCYPSLPKAIEASLVLTQAIIQDILFSNGTSLCQESEIALLYSMALVRFVGLIIEGHNMLASNTENAKCLGIPEWIVDLRNEATHSFQPSLPQLRMAADITMGFLDKNYWRVKSKELMNIVKEPVDYDNLKKLILSFQVYQYKLLGRKNKESPEYSGILEIQRENLKRISESLIKKNEVIEVLMMEGFFISLEDDLKLMLTEREISEFYNEDSKSVNGNDDKIIDNDKFLPMPMLPNTLEHFWAPIISVLSLKNAMHDFVEALLYSQASRDKTGQRLLASWVIKILTTVICLYGKVTSPLAKIFQRNCPIFDWERLLFAAVSKPCIYTPYIFPLIACHLDMEEDYARSLMNLLAISQGQALDPGFNLPNDHVAFTVEKFKQSKKLQDLKLEQKKKKDSNVWSLASDNIDFKNIPIGTVFKSSSDDESEVIDMAFNINIGEDVKYTEKFIWGNKNDEIMEDFFTDEQNSFTEDKKLISERETFLYKK